MFYYCCFCLCCFVMFIIVQCISFYFCFILLVFFGKFYFIFCCLKNSKTFNSFFFCCLTIKLAYAEYKIKYDKDKKKFTFNFFSL